MHASDEDLILHFYGEGGRMPVAEHLAACAQCRGEMARLERVLALVDEQPIPVPPPAFERVVWARLEPALRAAAPGWRQRLFGTPRRWAVAGGVAALLAAAFVAGRLSGPAAPAPASTAVDQHADRILVVAVVDHLDRSQLMLVELVNGSLDDPDGLGAEQARARELVAANRLYRQTAAQMGDEVIGDTLDELGRVLLEIANAPGDLTREDMAALRERIETRGLLFRVRVVQSEMRERERQTLMAGGRS